MLKRKKSILLALAALLAAGCLWYARPVGVDTLFPGLEPNAICVGMHDYRERGGKLYSRQFTVDAGTPEFDDLWEQLQALRFHRSPLNLIRRVLPFSTQRELKSPPREEDPIDLVLIALSPSSSSGSGILILYETISWSYNDMRDHHSLELPLGMRHSSDIGQPLTRSLWEQGIEQ